MVGAAKPKITLSRDRLLVNIGQVVSRLRSCIVPVNQETVDLGSLESGDAQIQIGQGQQLDQFAKFDLEQCEVPACVRSDLVIRQNKGALFCLGEAGDPERWD